MFWKNKKQSTGRKLYGFERTRCGCEYCRIPCRHMPGALDPSDLERLCPDGADLFEWAEEHLRALTHRSYPVLVPARQKNGHCHWLAFGNCAVHEDSPYGCAFFDTHMSNEDADRRGAPAIAARQKSAKENGLYYRVWRHLRDKGLIGDPGGRSAWRDEARRISRDAERRAK